MISIPARAWVAALLAIAIAGCVTINIYFPAAAAEQAADRIIDEVWQLKPPAGPPEEVAGPPEEVDGGQQPPKQ